MTRAPKSVPPDKIEVRRVERAAAVLSALEREVLVLSAGHGLGSATIAEKLGLGERRVERILAKALRKFDRAMDERPRPWWRSWQR